MSLATGTRLGPYKVLSALGAGGMGEVYKAHDTRLDRVVALKVLRAEYATDPNRRAQLEREARAVAALSHPHICALFDIGRDRDVDFLVMEYIDGETLSARIARGAPAASVEQGSPRKPRGLPVREALRFATDVADALAAAHRAGVVHLDLKPGNIMLTKGAGERAGSLQAKVLDFGLARRSVGPLAHDDSDTHEAESLIGPGVVAGTLPYMAPEQLDGRPVDARSDLFAFGALVYEMVAGCRAFRANTQAGLIASILEHDPEPLAAMEPLTPQGLERLVRKCLAKDPDARWQSASDVADELRWMRGGVETPRTHRDGFGGPLARGDGPNTGRLVAKLCNRQVQEEEFRDCFLEHLADHPGVPQMYFIVGEEGQCHESLVQRLVHLVDRSVASARRDDRAGGWVKKISWQYDGLLSQRHSRQVYSLFEHFGSSGGRHPYHGKDRSAATFAALLGGSLHAYIVIEHELHANRWDGIAAELLSGYRRFWSELAPSADRQVLLVFISVIFPRANESSLRRLVPLLDPAAFRRKRILSALKALEGIPGIPCRVLAELPPVTREDVLEWFSLNHIHDSEERRLRAIHRLFPPGHFSPKSMWEIESFCGDELRAFAAECVGAETR